MNFWKNLHIVDKTLAVIVLVAFVVIGVCIHRLINN